MRDLFPYHKVRDNQKKLLNDVKKSLKQGENLVAHAPTGLGKTAAVLPPALAYGKKNSKKVFFLTPRHSQHRIAVETLREVKEEHNLEFGVADLIGKKWLCNVDEVDRMSTSDFKEYCRSVREEDECPYYNNTVDKGSMELTDKALKAISSLKKDILHAEDVKNAHPNLCPYKVIMEFINEASVIIADYFHLFHPGVRESLLTRTNSTIEDAIVIVDEAHNLPSRTRSLNSVKMSSYQLDRAKKEANNFGYHELKSIIEDLNRIVRELAKKELEGEKETYIEEEDLIDRISNYKDYQGLISELEDVAEQVREDKKKSYCSGLANFLEQWKDDSEGYARILQKNKSKSGKTYYSVNFKCLDPQPTTSEPLNDSHSSILMSGTLTPLEMYIDILGLSSRSTRGKSYDSPFPEENRKNLIVDKVTTRYSERDEDQYKKIAWYILKSLENIPGNSGVFFPSYRMRDKIHSKMKGEIGKEMLLEKRDMNKEEKHRLFRKFSKLKDEGAVLLGVIGGSFGEGIDYPGSLMNAAFVVGLPLKKPDLETKAIIDFYDYKFGKGWEYGYSFPAMNRAIQASGRCIRSKEDRGVVLFLDERYLWSNYRKVFPPDMSLKQTKAPWQEIAEFYKN